MFMNRLRWPITATGITKRITVNKENFTNKNVLLTYEKGLLSYKQDLLTYTKKDLLEAGMEYPLCGRASHVKIKENK